MVEPQQDVVGTLLSEFNTKLRDIEEKQRLLKDRVLLIGENLVNSREELSKDIVNLKIASEDAKRDILKIKETLQRIMEELDTKARISEVEILKRQAKMFQPLELLKRGEQDVNN